MQYTKQTLRQYMQHIRRDIAEAQEWERGGHRGNYTLRAYITLLKETYQRAKDDYERIRLV